MDRIRLGPEFMKYVFAYLLLIASFSEWVAQTLQDTIYKHETELIVWKFRWWMEVWIPRGDISFPDIQIADIKWVQVWLPFSQDLESYFLPYIKIYIDSKDFLFAQQLNEYDDPDSDINQRVLQLTQSHQWKNDVQVLQWYFWKYENVLEIIRAFDFEYDANLEYNVNLWEIKIECIDHQFYIYFQFQ